MPSRRRFVDLDELEFFPRNLTHGQILERLGTFCPADVEALRVLAELKLREWWALTYHHDTVQPH